MKFRTTKREVSPEDQLQTLEGEQAVALALFEGVAQDLEDVSTRAEALANGLGQESVRLGQLSDAAVDRAVSAKNKAELLRGLFA